MGGRFWDRDFLVILGLRNENYCGKLPGKTSSQVKSLIEAGKKDVGPALSLFSSFWIKYADTESNSLNPSKNPKNSDTQSRLTSVISNMFTHNHNAPTSHLDADAIPFILAADKGMERPAVQPNRHFIHLHFLVFVPFQRSSLHEGHQTVVIVYFDSYLIAFRESPSLSQRQVLPRGQQSRRWAG